jgi:hypothetical protein
MIWYGRGQWGRWRSSARSALSAAQSAAPGWRSRSIAVGQQGRVSDELPRASSDAFRYMAEGQELWFLAFR